MKVKLKGGPLDGKEHELQNLKVLIQVGFYKDKKGAKKKRDGSKTQTLKYAVYELKRDGKEIYYKFVSKEK